MMRRVLINGTYRNYDNRLIENTGGIVHLAAFSCSAIQGDLLAAVSGNVRLDEPALVITCLWCAAELGRA